MKNESGSVGCLLGFPALCLTARVYKCLSVCSSLRTVIFLCYTPGCLIMLADLVRGRVSPAYLNGPILESQTHPTLTLNTL